jgi:hypothetical protein
MIIRFHSNKKTPRLLVRKRTEPTERPPILSEFQCQCLRIEGEGSRVVSATDLGFLDRSSFFFSSSSSFILTRLRSEYRLSDYVERSTYWILVQINVIFILIFLCFLTIFLTIMWTCKLIPTKRKCVDGLCCPVARAPGCSSSGPGFDYRRYQSL